MKTISYSQTLQLDNPWFGHRDYVTWDVYDLVKDKKNRVSVTPKDIVNFHLTKIYNCLEQNYLL